MTPLSVIFLPCKGLLSRLHAVLVLKSTLLQFYASFAGYRIVGIQVCFFSRVTVKTILLISGLLFLSEVSFHSYAFIDKVSSPAPGFPACFPPPFFLFPSSFSSSSPSSFSSLFSLGPNNVYPTLYSLNNLDFTGLVELVAFVPHTDLPLSFFYRSLGL